MTRHDTVSLLLGKQVAAPTQYAPDILFAIPRQVSSEAVSTLVMYGCDRWTAWELSWLNAAGVPQVAVAEFIFPAASPCLIESKSLKLYLHSLSSMRHANKAAVASLIQRDLSRVAQADVAVMLFELHALPARFQAAVPDATLLDQLDVVITGDDHPDASLLRVTGEQGSGVVYELLATHLFRSNCPVTGQPDWASVFVSYTGIAIEHASLLRYLCAFRHHQAFHESCVEKIYADIVLACQPQQLTVEAKFLRRGGLDINPLRSSDAACNPLAGRQLRQ